MRRLSAFASAVALAAAICSGPALALGGGHGGFRGVASGVGGGTQGGGFHSGVSVGGMRSFGNSGLEGRRVGINRGLRNGNGMGCIPPTSCSN